MSIVKTTTLLLEQKLIQWNLLFATSFTHFTRTSPWNIVHNSTTREHVHITGNSSVSELLLPCLPVLFFVSVCERGKKRWREERERVSE